VRDQCRRQVVDRRPNWWIESGPLPLAATGVDIPDQVHAQQDVIHLPRIVEGVLADEDNVMGGLPSGGRREE
jgi:hypothetical protein